MPTTLDHPLDPALLGNETQVHARSIDRFARAHDASHYLLVPDAVLSPADAEGVARAFTAVRAAGRTLTFRSGGTSLSGQGISGDILVDTRSHFRDIHIEEDGAAVRVGPGATVRQVNTRLSRYRRKLGPDPASEIACTIGGVVANNSSGMACGITENSYQTITSMVVVLPSGTVLDTGRVDAADVLRAAEPALFAGLSSLRERLLAAPENVAFLRQQFSMKNTMGYGLNALLDFDDPVRILEHLLIGSEGTLGFVAEARFRTIEVRPAIATGLLVFETLSAAMTALPALTELGLATIELLDAASLRVAQGLSDVPAAISEIDVQGHAALLVEVHAADDESLAVASASAQAHFDALPLAVAPRLTTDAAERAALWHVRKGLYTAVAGARPSGTTALLEDIVVPVPRLLATCERLIELFAEHGYEGSVIFGHAKDGNVHFLLNERFDDPDSVARYRRFTDDLVELVLAQEGSLKAEHGTGRIMAPFVRRQYGDELTDMMWEIKRLFDPDGILNPGVVLSDDPDSYLQDLKRVPTVEHEVDRCVECGYCEPTCPSKSITLTPRQRIVLRRDMAWAEEQGDTALLRDLRADYDYDGVQTCAVDGMCGVACPVDINTGDLVRRLRAEQENAVEGAAWGTAAKHWSTVTRAGGVALTVADALPVPLVRGATRVGRAVLGADTVPLYDGGLPRGGTAPPRPVSPSDAQAVFFGACIGTMFGPEDEGPGSRDALRALLDRAGIPVVVPEENGGLCCGTPWKSKGHLDGYRLMSNRVLASLWDASRHGELPVVCDAASCTEGLDVMLTQAVAAHPEYAGLRIEDATTFVAREVLPRLSVDAKLPSIAVHPTCSTTALGATGALTAIAAAVADEVFVPDGWGCCAFAGDRGMLHPELTASATAQESAEVAAADTARGGFDAFVSANRTCEIGMTRATGRPYRHVIEVLEERTRPSGGRHRGATA
ncbi:FAD-binding and (Fe-S)-binding domain-containing protein [Microbacterium sp. str. 'China']|uniref:FAD-binding and (Fe-S)-binding domain-containing protein n=1 Tax=Microbacterium sp. str. 'China' TaxID=2103230 RepID=UPI000D012427|nr:FAD-binding and (Fe-S)-binding domain-containing protein [Microbacterium sp. str. 'China']AVL96976.1 FAD-binding oxidoreductase [Microbacterium sp. str. 'China']